MDIFVIPVVICSGYEGYSLLVYDAMWFCRVIQVFKATCMHRRVSRWGQQVALITFCVWPEDGHIWEVAHVLVNQRQ